MKKSYLIIILLVTSRLIAQTPGNLDLTFNPGTGTNNNVYATAIQADGKIIIGGSFTTYNGTTSNYIVRVNSDGTLDNSFAIGTGIGPAYFGSNSYVSSIAIQNDGKIIVAGGFLSFNGLSRNMIVRLNSDGTIDNTFIIGTGFGSDVYSLALQNDGKILVGGGYNSYNNTTANHLARLKTNGGFDSTFLVGTSVSNGPVRAVAVQGDGKIICSGFSTGIGRLGQNGNVDNTFNVGTGIAGNISAISIQSDGKIIIGGSFTSYNGTNINGIVRIDSNGAIDNGFNSGLAVGDFVNSIVIQADGKMVIGGGFNNYGSTSRKNIARINANGTLDNTFNVGTGASGYVRSTKLQNDGAVVIGGEFFTYNGISRQRIARLNGNNLATSLPVYNSSEEFKVYPNPVNSSLYIEPGIESNITITNILNKTILTQQVIKGKNEINLSDLANGVYFIKAGNSSFKIIKQ